MAEAPEGARHYTGLVVEAYDLWLEQNPPGDEPFYRGYLEEGGEPALEVACGTGRLLLEYVAEGFDVDGVDASEPMLERCREKAAARGLDPALYLQPMEGLDLPRRYRTLFVPYGSLQALVDFDDLEAALQGFREHLVPGGRLVVALFVPGEELDPLPRWRIRREATRPDEATILMHEAVDYDRAEQVLTAWYRYEVVGEDGRIARAEMRKMRQRWFEENEFRLLLEAAGLEPVRTHGDYGAEPYGEEHSELVWVARRPDAAG
ncbi:MAG: class I SAM-dependent methyltransferase [Gemmatimonadota bacterium]|nr:class I SAM-dependent methyltransferase [Gemmatimonadota bacterium]